MFVLAACAGPPAIVRGADGGVDGRSDLVATADGREDPVDVAGRADAPDGGPRCEDGFPAHLECLDGADNDGDGLTDYADPDCTAFDDNDESSFAVRIATDEEDFFCHRDCYFDGNFASGDDSCSHSLSCDAMNPGADKCPYRPGAACPEAPDRCREACLPKTPNGCDCFGCCALVRNGVSTTVLLSTKCDDANLDDPLRCPPCTQEPSCLNPCDACEVCFGKPRPEPGCWGDGGSPDLPPPGQCPPGVTPCGPGGVDPCACPADTYCVTGCCAPI